MVDKKKLRIVVSIDVDRSLFTKNGTEQKDREIIDAIVNEIDADLNFEDKDTAFIRLIDFYNVVKDERMK